MKRMSTFIILPFTLFVFLLMSACSNTQTEQAQNPDQTPDTTQAQDSEKDAVSAASEWAAQEVGAEDIKTSNEGFVVDNAFVYNHINGKGEETKRLAYVLYEFETLKYVKYQVAYLACT